MTYPALIFFSESEAAIVEAMAARIIPTDTSGPGAREAGVIDYIDRALSGYYRDLQTFYRRGVRALDALCHERFGAGFRALGEDQQDAVLASVERPADDEPDAFLRMFFAVVRRHTIEGRFCDPAYGGNRDLVGWRLVGFPGAQWSYSAEQMRPGFDSTQIPIKTLEDLRREHGTEVSHGRAH